MEQKGEIIRLFIYKLLRRVSARGYYLKLQPEKKKKLHAAVKIADVPLARIQPIPGGPGWGPIFSRGPEHLICI